MQNIHERLRKETGGISNLAVCSYYRCISGKDSCKCSYPWKRARRYLQYLQCFQEDFVKSFPIIELFRQCFSFKLLKWINQYIWIDLFPWIISNCLFQRTNFKHSDSIINLRSTQIIPALLRCFNKHIG